MAGIDISSGREQSERYLARQTYDFKSTVNVKMNDVHEVKAFGNKKRPFRRESHLIGLLQIQRALSVCRISSFDNPPVLGISSDSRRRALNRHEQFLLTDARLWLRAL